MADDENQLLEEARRRPLAERIAHKLWKARVEVYEEMRSKCEKVFSEEDPLLESYGSYLPKAVIDTNAAVLDKGLELTIEYLKKCSVAQAAKICDKVCTGLITKALSGRPGTVMKSTEATLLLVEDEQGDKVSEAFISKGFVHKVPKVALACVDILFQCVNQFGTKAMAPQPILKALPPLFDSKDAKIRSKVKELVAELAKWVGANSVKSILFEKMRDAMKEDIEKLIAQIPEGRPTAQRLTRSQQIKQATQGSAAEQSGEGSGGGAAAAAEEPEEPEVDEYDLAEPSEVVSQLDREWWANLQEKKWSIRKGALSQLKTLASKPRLATGDYSEINREIKKIITKDSNVQCVAEAVWCVAALAKGLRKEFSVAKSYCPMLLEKFKEKNMSVCRACMEALTNLNSYCFTLLDVQEDVQEALKHQNPKVKQCTLEWMKICLDNSTKQMAAKFLPVYNASIASCSDDATPLTRERALDVLVAFCMKATSAAAIDKITAKLDDARKKKLDEMLKEAREGKNKSTPQTATTVAPPAAAKPSTSAPKPATSKDPSAMEVEKPNSKPKKSGQGKGSSSKGSSSKASQQPKSTGPKSNLGEVDEESLKNSAMAKEGAERGFTELFGEEVVTGLNSSVWKERMAALESMYEKLPTIDLGLHGTLLIQGISQLPGWTEKIFQVMGKAFEVMRYVVENSTALSRSDAYAAITGLLEKIADIKLKTLSWETLLSVCEHVGLHFVFSVIYALAKKNRNPKVLSEGLNWMKTAIQEFGLGPWIDTRVVIKWVVEELGNTIPAVKNGAVGLIDMIRPNVKPALMTTIEAEFEKNPQDASFVPNRKIKGLKGTTATAGQDGTPMEICETDEAEAPAFNPDDILPRADISPQINDKIAAQLNNANWKERKAAMDTIEQLLVESGNRIQPTVGDLFPALKGRFSDANKNLIAQALKVFSKLAIAMGKPIERQGKGILEPALQSLADAKPVVRAAVIDLMDAWCSVASMNLLLSDFIGAVASPKSHVDGKKEAFVWLNKMATDGRIGKDSLELCVKACAVGLNDKAGQVREASSTLLQTLLTKFGDAIPPLASAVDASMKTAFQEAVQKVIGTSQSGGSAMPSNKPSTAEKPSKVRPSEEQTPEQPKKGRRSNGTAASKAALVTKTAEVPPLFVFSPHKEDRAYQNRGKRAKVEGAAPEDEAVLKSEMEPYVAPHLHTLLFAADFKKHCTAAELIKDALQDFYKEILSCLDYVFRWSVLRINQGKIQCLTLVLEMLKCIFEKLASESYRLSEYEAVILLPCIVDKVGHNQDRIKRYHRDIICLATTVYPASKVFTFVSQGLTSKNTRTRVECIEEIGSMIDRDGMRIASGNKQSKCLEEIATAVADRDKAVRAACLSTLTTIYDFEGDRIWKLLGRLTSQQKSLIEERFKTHQKTLAEKSLGVGHRGSRPSTPACPPSRLPTPEGTKARRKNNNNLLDSTSTNGDLFPRPPSQVSGRSLQSPMPPLLDTPDVEHVSPKEASPTAALPNVTQPDLRPVNVHPKPVLAAKTSPMEMSLSPLPPALEAADDEKIPERSDSVVEEAWSRAMIIIQSEDLEEAIESLKIICYEMDMAKNGTPMTVQLMKDSADELVKELTKRMHRFVLEIVDATEKGLSPPSERPCKYTLNTLLQTFLAPFMASSIEKDTLLELVSSLLQLLLDDRLTRVPEGHTIMKGMNVLMLKILELSQLNSVIAILIFLLRSPPPQILAGEADRQNRFFSLVVKCLIKATKRMGSLLEQETVSERDFSIGNVLLEIHDFCEKLGPDELRRRGEVDDKPLRMVKTILYEICRYKGYDIVQFLDSIPQHGSPPPIILGYINVNLQTLRATGAIRGSPPTSGVQKQSVIDDYFKSMNESAAMGKQSSGGVNTPASPARTNGSTTPVGDSRQDAASNELKTELAAIFKKIGDKNATQKGLECLYDFQQEHPDIDVKPFLGNTSDAFRAYIQNGLKAIHEKRQKTDPDPMDIDEAVENIEDTPDNLEASPEGHYVMAEREMGTRKPQAAATYH